MRSFLLFTALLVGIAALTCFQDVTDGSAPTRTAVCPSNTTQCVKIAGKSSGQKAMITACDIPSMGANGKKETICDGLPNGQCTTAKGPNGSGSLCCCGSDRCNASGFFQPIVAIILMLVGSFVL